MAQTVSGSGHIDRIRGDEMSDSLIEENGQVDMVLCSIGYPS